MLAVLADRKWHDIDELIDAATTTGVARKTAQNILSDAAAHAHLARHGRGRVSRFALPLPCTTERTPNP